MKFLSFGSYRRTFARVKGEKIVRSRDVRLSSQLNLHLFPSILLVTHHKVVTAFNRYIILMKLSKISFQPCAHP